MASQPLPANAIIGEAFAFVFSNLRQLAPAAAVPFGVATVSLLRSVWARYDGPMETYAVVIWVLILTVSAVPFQTQVYRFALKVTEDSTPRFGWPWGRRETTFALNAVALAIAASTISVIVLVILLLITPVGGGSHTSPDAMAGTVAGVMIVGAPAMLIGLYAAARISPSFAAAAVGHRFNWREIWRGTTGNGWRIVWVLMVTIVPWWLADTILQFAMGLLDNAAAIILFGLVGQVVSFIGMAVPAAGCAFIYRSLMLPGARRVSFTV